SPSLLLHFLPYLLSQLLPSHAFSRRPPYGFLASSPRSSPMCTPLCARHAMPCHGQELDARLQSVGLQYTLALVPRNVSYAHALRCVARPRSQVCRTPTLSGVSYAPALRCVARPRSQVCGTPTHTSPTIFCISFSLALPTQSRSHPVRSACRPRPLPHCCSCTSTKARPVITPSPSAAPRYAPLYRAAPQGGGRAGAGRQDVRYSAAHAEVWARVVAAGMPFALVLEEDALNRNEGVAAWQARFEMVTCRRGGGGAQRDHKIRFLLPCSTRCLCCPFPLHAHRARAQPCLRAPSPAPLPTPPLPLFLFPPPPQLLWELNLLMLQRGDRFFFDVLLLARHGLAPYAEQQLAPGIVSAQPSEAMHAYLLSYAGAKRLLALSRFHSYSPRPLLPPLRSPHPCHPNVLIPAANAHACMCLFNPPVAESTGGIPGMTILAAEPPLLATTIFACSPKPCRTPPPALSLPASTRLTPACRSTILLALPAHPSMPGAALHAPWRMHDPAPAGPSPSIPSSSPAFCPHLSPAQCLLAHHLQHLLPHVRAPPPLPLPLTLPPSLPLWPAYVLSLRRSPQRLQRVLPLLQKEGFGDVVVALGVDGGRMHGAGGGAQGRGEEADLEAERNLDVFGGLVGAGAVSVTRRSIKWHKLAERRRERLTRGEVACALSHYLVWLEVLRRKLPYAIILEDDVTFTTSTFRAGFERNIAEANELLTRQHSPESPPDILFVGHMGVLAGHFMPLLSPHIAWDPLSWCSFAYIISHRGAERLVAGFKVDDPLDSLWWRRPNLAFWAFQPPLAFHLSSPRLNSSLPLSPPSPPAPPPPSHPPHPSSTHRTAHSSSSIIKDKASSSGAEVAGSSRAGEDMPLPVPLYPSEVQQGGGQWM
ncbi:unnamed protein product, partial [Closterium sp. Naga37s-1]